MTDLACAVYNMGNLALSAESISTLNSDSDSSGEPFQRDRSTAGSFVSISDEGENPEQAQQARYFQSEAATSLLEGLEKGEDPSNMLLELNALR
jgi:translation initiation factor eIF-2B subunit epsilon